MERDNILGALIGLVGATSNSGKTVDTDRISSLWEYLRP